MKFKETELSCEKVSSDTFGTGSHLPACVLPLAPVESTTLEKDYVSKLVNKELLRDKTRKQMRKQQLFPKSWQFKYNKMMMLRVTSELLGLANGE